MFAPRYQEPASAGPALSSATGAISALAAARGLPPTAARDEQADPAALRRFLAEADLATVLCHGYSGADEDAALLLADRGLLATLGRIQPRSRWHFVSARRIRALPRTSAIVVLGESLGIYAAFAAAAPVF